MVQCFCALRRKPKTRSSSDFSTYTYMYGTAHFNSVAPVDNFITRFVYRTYSRLNSETMLDAGTRRSIFYMRKVKKLSYRTIAQQISATRGERIPHTVVHYWCQLLETNGTSYVFSNRRPSHATRQKVTTYHLQLIEESLQHDPECSSVDLQKQIAQKTGTTISPSSIRAHRAKLGWTYKKTRYCQLVRDANKAKRLEWSEKQLQNKETFDDVIFTDEASFEIQRSATKMFYKRGQKPKLRPKPKHPVKVGL